MIRWLKQKLCKKCIQDDMFNAAQHIYIDVVNETPFYRTYTYSQHRKQWELSESTRLPDKCIISGHLLTIAE